MSTKFIFPLREASTHPLGYHGRIDLGGQMIDTSFSVRVERIDRHAKHW
jgi:hypothetical protein